MFMVRKPEDIPMEKIQKKSDTESVYNGHMIRASKMHAKMIFETGKIFGPMTDDEQAEAIAWAYGMDLVK